MKIRGAISALGLVLLAGSPMFAATREAVLLNNSGLQHYYRHENDLALNDLNRSLEIEPDSVIVHKNRGLVYLELGKFDLAIADCDFVLAGPDANAKTYVCRAMAYEGKGDDRKAIQDYSDAISKDGTLVNAYYHRALLYRFTDQLTKALADHDRTIALDPQSALYYDSRGNTYRRMEKWDKALADFNSALALKSEAPIFLNDRGLAFDEKQDYELALADFNKALAIDPTLTAIRRNRDEALEEWALTAGAGGAPDAVVFSGEIRLDGTVQVCRPELHQFVLEAAAFTLPGGKRSHLKAPRLKTVTVDAATLFRDRVDAGHRPAMVDLGPGVVVTVVGSDLGSGHALPARQVVVGVAAPEAVEVAAPLLPENVVVRPTFTRKDGKTWRAGTAFGARLDDGRKVLLTALHLFGVAGGLEADIKPDQIADEVTSVSLSDMSFLQQFGVAGKPLLHSGFVVGSRGDDLSGDVAAFAVPADAVTGTIPLAPAPPPPGEAAWLFGRAVASGQLGLCRGTVMISEARRVVVRLDKQVVLQAASGAPVVNAKGEAIGMLIGGEDLGRFQYILLNPAPAMRQLLAATAQ